MKKTFLILSISILMLFSSCSLIEKQIELDNYEELNTQYVEPLLRSDILSTWNSEQEIESFYFARYFAQDHNNSKYIINSGEDGVFSIPSQETENYVQKHFNISTEYLRNCDNYNSNNKTYDNIGVDCCFSSRVVKAKNKKDNILLDFEIYGGNRNEVVEKGTMAIDISDEDYKYLWCKSNYVLDQFTPLTIGVSISAADISKYFIEPIIIPENWNETTLLQTKEISELSDENIKNMARQLLSDGWDKYRYTHDAQKPNIHQYSFDIRDNNGIWYPEPWFLTLQEMCFSMQNTFSKDYCDKLLSNTPKYKEINGRLYFNASIGDKNKSIKSDFETLEIISKNNKEIIIQIKNKPTRCDIIKDKNIWVLKYYPF